MKIMNIKKNYEILKHKNMFSVTNIVTKKLTKNVLLDDITNGMIKNLKKKEVVSMNFTLQNLLRFSNLIRHSFFNLSLPFFNTNSLQFTRFHGQCYGYDFNSVLADFN